MTTHTLAASNQVLDYGSVGSEGSDLRVDVLMVEFLLSFTHADAYFP